MKKILIATILAAFSMSALAVDDITRQNAVSSVNGVTSISIIDNRAPETQTINTNSTISGGTSNYTENHQSGTATLKSVPPVYAPNIITSNDTCMGSSSIGASGVGFGVSFGTSWTDANCIMLKNAREMYNMGMPDVAFARLCMDALNREAIELTGKVCPQTVREEKAKAEAAQQAAAQ